MRPPRPPADPAPTLDRGLPRWARRSHPVVRRHLGGFHKVYRPEPGPLLRLLIAQSALLVATFAFPPLLEVIALSGTAALLFLMPALLWLYGRALLRIGQRATAWTLAERQADTLLTLRSTPIPLWEILLAKIAAAAWQQMDMLNLLLTTTALAALPLMIVEHATLYPPEQHPLLARLLPLAGLWTSVARIMVEPLLVGAVGALVGSMAAFRLPAVTVTGLLIGVYFLLLNLPRLLILSWPARLLVETLLPLLLPVVIAAAALIAANHLLRQNG